MRALGLDLPTAGLVQVSMNVTDWEAAALHEIVERIAAEAAARGVEVAGSELVGLMPAGAAVAAAGPVLRIEGFDPSHVLELRLLEGALEVELAPRRPPVVGPRDDRSPVEHLDAGPVVIALYLVRPRVLDLDLARLARVVGLDLREILERALGAVLDELPRAGGREIARAEPAQPLLDGDRRDAFAEELGRLARRRRRRRSRGRPGNPSDRRAPR